MPLPRWVPKHAAPILLGFLLSGFMSLMMAGLVTLINLGLTPTFVAQWVGGFIRTWPIAFPVDQAAHCRCAAWSRR